MAYKPQGQFKPGKIGKVTTALYQDKNIGIDGKVYQILDERVDRIRQDNPQLGDEVEYKLSADKDLTKKGKISFFAIKNRAGAGGVQQPVTPNQPSAQVEHKPAETQDIQAEYVSKDQMKVTLKDCKGEEQTFRADLDIIKLLTKSDAPITGQKYRFRLVKTDGEWVVSKMGAFDPTLPEEPFRSGKEILQQNLDEKKAETAKAEAALAQINKENAEGEKRIEENKEYLKNLTEATGATKTMSPAESPKEPEKCQQNESVNVSDIFLKECPVTLKVHLDCGSWSNIDLEMPAMPIDQAIVKVEEDAKKAIAMMHRLMVEAKKGY